MVGAGVSGVSADRGNQLVGNRLGIDLIRISANRRA